VCEDNKTLKKRSIKRSQTSERLKAQTGYKRISNSSEDLGYMKKRRETFVIEPKKSSLISCSPKKLTSSNDTAGNITTYKDKALSMSERLQLWRAEKRKGNSGKTAGKSKPMETKLKRKSGIKENLPHYHKLENISRGFCTPASTKPLSRVQTKSTIKKTRFVTPSNQTNSVVHSNSVIQSKRKSVVKAVKNCEVETSNVAHTSKDTSEANANNPKTYKDKTLDMRERLELWLAEKGKTPKYKTPALVKNPMSLQQQNLQEKKRLSFDCCEESEDTQFGRPCVISPGEGENIEEKLRECLLQLERGECDLAKVAAKLDLYNSSCPHTSQIANYWLCRAKIAQQQKDFDRVVCLFEQALVFKAQPESTIKDAVCAFVTFMKENGNHEEMTDEICHVPQSPPNDSTTDEKDNTLEDFNSSIIKFCLTEATPYRKKFKATFGKPVLTPVRRSVRLERVSTQYPSVLQEHDLTVRTLGELPEDLQQNVLFKPNFAVRAELNEAWYQLQLGDNQ